MTVSRKKVIVRKFQPGFMRGYLSPSSFVQQHDDRSSLELLDLTGRVQYAPLADIKMVSFVREFNMADDVAPERLPRKTFLARPRTEGLWLKLTFRDDDQMEGLAPLDLSLADGLIEDQGIQLIPPDIRGNAQRIYVPRLAIRELQIIAVVTTPSRKKPEVPPSAQPEPDLFTLQLPENARPQ